MCGIVGVINGTKSWADVHGVDNFMKEGCVAGMFRGDDSTGLMQFNKHHQVRVVKDTLNGYQFGQTKRVDAMLGMADSQLATILHHRKATQGGITYDNCHPFEHETPGGKYVVGVHNGGIKGWKHKEDGIDFQVDSDWLYWQIARDGGPKALGAVDGAYALVWHEQEKEQNRFFISCNEERSLHWAFLKDQNAMLIASEASMLWWLAQRNNIQIEDILRPKKGFVYEFDVEEGLRKFKQIPLVVPAPKPVVPTSFLDRPEQGPKPRLAWNPASKAYEQKQGKYIYRDVMGAEGLKDVPFECGQEADFVFQNTRQLGPERTQVEVKGEITVHRDGKPVVWEMMIDNVPKSMAENMRRADECWVRVIGMREEIDTTNGAILPMLIGTVPFAIKIDDDDKPPQIDIVPWDDWGHDAMDAWAEITSSDSPSGPTLRGPGGKYISKARWEHLTKDGCGHCSAPIIAEDAEEIGWWDSHGGPLCSECATHLASGDLYSG